MAHAVLLCALIRTTLCAQLQKLSQIGQGGSRRRDTVGGTIVRKWFDADGVDMVIAGPNSAVGLAVSFVAQEKDKVCMGAAVTASEFAGKQCTPNTVN